MRNERSRQRTGYDKEVKMNDDIWHRDNVIVIVDTFFQPPIDTPAERNTYSQAFPKHTKLSEIMCFAETIDNVQSIRLVRNGDRGK